jgi:hypothetical protein
MRDLDDIPIEPVNPDADDLVRRLRELEWPAVQPEVRERCWVAFSERVGKREAVPGAATNGNGSGPQRAVARRNVGRRLDFTRREPLAPRAPIALSAARTPAWAARPTRKIAAFVA